MTTTLYVPVQTLRSAILATYWSCDHGSTRYALGGVSLQTRDKTLYAIATDSRRMSIYNLGECSEDVDVLIPYKSVRELEKRLTKTARGSATITIVDNTVSIAWIDHNQKERRVEFAPLDGRFPRWFDVIPTAKPCGTLSGKARQLGELFPTERRQCTLSLNGHVELHQNVVKADPFVKYKGSELLIDFDMDYLAEWIDSRHHDAEVTCSFFDDESPALMESGPARYVVMPMSRD